MRKHSTAQVRSKAKMVEKIIKHHFGHKPTSLTFKPAGMTNFVFDVSCKEGEFIVRIAGSTAKINDFIKEQWATSKAIEVGVPVPEILEVDNEVINAPYMLQQRVEGKEATNHPKRLDILYDLGQYARLIHSIPTSNFGKVFDWSKNRLSKNITWSNFLEDELEVTHRLKFLGQENILTYRNFRKLAAIFERIKKSKIMPHLNHGDLRLKNVLVNDNGKIIALIDWENCTSNIAPYWDFSIALHDLSIDGKQRFLEGYDMDVMEFSRRSFFIKAFNIINYVPEVKRLLDRKDKLQLELYRLRLNGDLDLFSL